MTINKKLIFVTPWSDDENRASMDKYAFQMLTELEKKSIFCSVLPVKVNGCSYVTRIFSPLFTSRTLLFCKEKIIYIHYAFFINFIFLLPFLFFAKILFKKRIILQIHEFREFLPVKNIVKYIDLLYCKVENVIIVHNNEQFDILKKIGFKQVYLLHMPVEPINTIDQNTKKNNNIQILMHWGIIRKKWYEVGIKALSLLPKHYTMVIVWWSWDKLYFWELTSLIEQLWLFNRIDIIDKYLPEFEYERYIKESDILFYPYLISTASAALAEGALKFWKPFLTSDIESFITYLWTDKYSFISWDYKGLSQKTLTLNLKDASDFANLIKQKYSWEKVWPYLEDVINKL